MCSCTFSPLVLLAVLTVLNCGVSFALWGAGTVNGPAGPTLHPLTLGEVEEWTVMPSTVGPPAHPLHLQNEVAAMAKLSSTSNFILPLYCAFQDARSVKDVLLEAAEKHYEKIAATCAERRSDGDGWGRCCDDAREE